MPDFDDWLAGYSSETRNNVPPRNVTSIEDMWSAPYFEKLTKILDEGGNLEEFISAKNEDLKNRYIKEKSAPLIQDAENASNKRQIIEKCSQEAQSIDKKLTAFEHDVNDLLQKYPPERRSKLKEFLSNYALTGEFEKDSKLTEKPKGFINKLKYGKKIKEANKSLEDFIEKYSKDNLAENIEAMSADPTFNSSSKDLLKNKFRSIAELDNENTAYYNNELTKKNSDNQSLLSSTQRDIDDCHKKINSIQRDCDNSYRLTKEDDAIRAFSAHHQERLHPQQLDISDYVERLDKLKDDDVVVFNIGLSNGKSTETKLKNVLKYNGLEAGNAPDQWFINKGVLENSDKGKYELFSPPMTVQKAKEIMPQLIKDFDDAKISSGIIVPMKASEFIDTKAKSATTNITSEELEKLINGARIQENIEAISSGRSFGQDKDWLDKALQKTGYNSTEELPEVIFTREKLQEKFPQDKYLFSGGTASDDYCPFSSRIGRNGTVYATPELSYAANYDGITDVGFGKGVKATGDKYVDAVVGQAFQQDVSVGFINVYEQNPNDKYFDNFGMEDYRSSLKNIKENPQTYYVYERTPEGPIYTDETIQTPTGKRLTREQAVNGYVGKGAIIQEKDGKSYTLRYKNSETFVTPEKNPLKAKIMHIQCGNKEYYIPVTEKSQPVVQKILDARKADIYDTFTESRGYGEFLQRLQKQREDFLAGKTYETPAKSSSPSASIKETMKTDASNAQRVMTNLTEESISHAAEKTAVKTAGTVAAKTTSSTSKGVIETVAKADNALNKAIETTIEKGSQALNETKAGKAYEKITEKVAESKVGKTATKIGEKVSSEVSKTVTKVASTKAAQSAGKVAAKTGAKAVGKSVLKKIPLVSVGAGAYFAYDRIKNGEYKAAACEMLSGIAGCFPGLGTAASTAIDVGLAGNDIHTAVKATKSSQDSATQKTQVSQKSKNQMLEKSGRTNNEQSKQPVRKTTLNTKNIAQAKSLTH